MYAIRVRSGSAILDVAFSGEVTTAEALRAVSQGFVLAEAGGIHRALCDVREALATPFDASSVIAASFVTRMAPGDRVAVLCTAEQLPAARRFARFANIGEELAVFTRPEDAEEWLAGVPVQRLSRAALQHFGAFDIAVTGPRFPQPDSAAGLNLRAG